MGFVIWFCSIVGIFVITVLAIGFIKWLKYYRLKGKEDEGG